MQPLVCVLICYDEVSTLLYSFTITSYEDQLKRIQIHAKSCSGLPRIVCGDARAEEPKAPALVRIWATPKNMYKKVFLIFTRYFVSIDTCIV